MPKVVWNGGFELDWKTIGFVLWGAFVTGGGWVKLENLQAVVTQHLEEARVRGMNEAVLNTRQSVLEERMDNCCPHAKAYRMDDFQLPLKRGRSEGGAP